MGTRLGRLGLILLGGSLGTAARAWLESTFAPPLGQWPWVTLGINLGGAALLGGLLQALAVSGPDAGWRRRVRLGLGTGLLGGFTTYSTFAVETVGLARVSWLLGLAYALVSVVGGFLAAAGAMGLVDRLARQGVR